MEYPGHFQEFRVRCQKAGSGVDINHRENHQKRNQYGQIIRTDPDQGKNDKRGYRYRADQKHKGLQNLAQKRQGFANRAMEPFLVTVDPDSANRPVNLSSHDGQEFNYIESGCMELHVGGNVIELHEGDTIMFDARRPHGMRALGGTPLKFIAIII